MSRATQTTQQEQEEQRDDQFEMARKNADALREFGNNHTEDEALAAIARVLHAHVTNNEIDPDDWAQAGLPPIDGDDQ